MRIDNPTTFLYSHQNFNGGVIRISLNDIGTDETALAVEVVAPDGRKGEIKLQMQDNGTVRARIHRDANNPITALVVDGTGILFEG